MYTFTKARVGTGLHTLVALVYKNRNLAMYMYNKDSKGSPGNSGDSYDFPYDIAYPDGNYKVYASSYYNCYSQSSDIYL
jgi:hypothetical protein